MSICPHGGRLEKDTWLFPAAGHPSGIYINDCLRLKNNFAFGMCWWNQNLVFTKGFGMWSVGLPENTDTPFYWMAGMVILFQMVPTRNAAVIVVYVTPIVTSTALLFLSQYKCPSYNLWRWMIHHPFPVIRDPLDHTGRLCLMFRCAVRGQWINYTIQIILTRIVVSLYVPLWRNPFRLPRSSFTRRRG